MPHSVREHRSRSTQRRRTRSVCMVSVHGDPLVPTGAEEAGGQNVYVRELAQALAARGVHVDVFTRGRDVPAAVATALGEARVIQVPCGPPGFVPRAELFAHLPEFVRGVRRWTRREGMAYDLVHSNYWLSGWVGTHLASAWGCPQVHTHHSLGAVKYAAAGATPNEARTRLDIEDALSRLAARIVTTSPQEVESLARLYPSEACTAIIPCGVSPLFHPRPISACRAALGLPLDGPIVAYVGRFDEAKGIDTAVEAVARLPAALQPTLVFAGGYDPAAKDVREFNRIQELVRAGGLEERSVFLGRMAHEELALAYGAADVVVVPSHYESFGLVAIEAMACGRPVVASEVGGLRYSVVHGETGLLAPVRDAEAFSRAISCLLGDPALRARLGDAGAQLVQRMFTWDAVAERLCALYDDVQPAAIAKAPCG